MERFDLTVLEWMECRGNGKRNKTTSTEVAITPQRIKEHSLFFDHLARTKFAMDICQQILRFRATKGSYSFSPTDLHDHKVNFNSSITQKYQLSYNEWFACQRKDFLGNPRLKSYVKHMFRVPRSDLYSLYVDCIDGIRGAREKGIKMVSDKEHLEQYKSPDSSRFPACASYEGRGGQNYIEDYKKEMNTNNNHYFQNSKKTSRPQTTTSAETRERYEDTSRYRGGENERRSNPRTQTPPSSTERFDDTSRYRGGQNERRSNRRTQSPPSSTERFEPEPEPFSGREIYERPQTRVPPNARRSRYDSYHHNSERRSRKRGRSPPPPTEQLEPEHEPPLPPVTATTVADDISEDEHWDDSALNPDSNARTNKNTKINGTPEITKKRMSSQPDIQYLGVVDGTESTSTPIEIDLTDETDLTDNFEPMTLSHPLVKIEEPVLGPNGFEIQKRRVEADVDLDKVPPVTRLFQYIRKSQSIEPEITEEIQLLSPGPDGNSALNSVSSISSEGSQHARPVNNPDNRGSTSTEALRKEDLELDICSPVSVDSDDVIPEPRPELISKSIKNGQTTSPSAVKYVDPACYGKPSESKSSSENVVTSVQPQEDKTSPGHYPLPSQRQSFNDVRQTSKAIPSEPINSNTQNSQFSPKTPVTDTVEKSTTPGCSPEEDSSGGVVYDYNHKAVRRVMEKVTQHPTPEAGQLINPFFNVSVRQPQPVPAPIGFHLPIVTPQPVPHPSSTYDSHRSFPNNPYIQNYGHDPNPLVNSRDPRLNRNRPPYQSDSRLRVGATISPNSDHRQSGERSAAEGFHVPLPDNPLPTVFDLHENRRMVTQPTSPIANHGALILTQSSPAGAYLPPRSTNHPRPPPGPLSPLSNRLYGIIQDPLSGLVNHYVSKSSVDSEQDMGRDSHNADNAYATTTDTATNNPSPGHKSSDHQYEESASPLQSSKSPSSCSKSRSRSRSHENANRDGLSSERRDYSNRSRSRSRDSRPQSKADYARKRHHEEGGSDRDHYSNNHHQSSSKSCHVRISDNKKDYYVPSSDKKKEYHEPSSNNKRKEYHEPSDNKRKEYHEPSSDSKRKDCSNSKTSGKLQSTSHTRHRGASTSNLSETVTGCGVRTSRPAKLPASRRPSAAIASPEVEPPADRVRHSSETTISTNSKEAKNSTITHDFEQVQSSKRRSHSGTSSGLGELTNGSRVSATKTTGKCSTKSSKAHMTDSTGANSAGNTVSLTSKDSHVIPEARQVHAAKERTARVANSNIAAKVVTAKPAQTTSAKHVRSNNSTSTRHTAVPRGTGIDVVTVVSIAHKDYEPVAKKPRLDKSLKNHPTNVGDDVHTKSSRRQPHHVILVTEEIGPSPVDNDLTKLLEVAETNCVVVETTEDVSGPVESVKSHGETEIGLVTRESCVIPGLEDSTILVESDKTSWLSSNIPSATPRITSDVGKLNGEHNSVAPPSHDVGGHPAIRDTGNDKIDESTLAGDDFEGSEGGLQISIRKDLFDLSECFNQEEELVLGVTRETTKRNSAGVTISSGRQSTINLTPTPLLRTSSRFSANVSNVQYTSSIVTKTADYVATPDSAETTVNSCNPSVLSTSSQISVSISGDSVTTTAVTEKVSVKSQHPTSDVLQTSEVKEESHPVRISESLSCQTSQKGESGQDPSQICSQQRSTESDDVTKSFIPAGLSNNNSNPAQNDSDKSDFTASVGNSSTTTVLNNDSNHVVKDSYESTPEPTPSVGSSFTVEASQSGIDQSSSHACENSSGNLAPSIANLMKKCCGGTDMSNTVNGINETITTGMGVLIEWSTTSATEVPLNIHGNDVKAVLQIVRNMFEKVDTAVISMTLRGEKMTTDEAKAEKLNRKVSIETLASYFITLVLIQHLLATDNKVVSHLPLQVLEYRVTRILRHFAFYETRAPETTLMNILNCAVRMREKNVNRTDLHCLNVHRATAAMDHVMNFTDEIDKSSVLRDNETLGADGFSRQVNAFVSANQRRLAAEANRAKAVQPVPTVSVPLPLEGVPQQGPAVQNPNTILIVPKLEPVERKTDVETSQKMVELPTKKD